MNRKEVRRRCEQVLRDVEVPTPFDLGVFSQVVSRRRGRPLHLIAKETALGPCGVWVVMPQGDFVFYEDATSAMHRRHIILHELGHLLSNHPAAERIDDDVLRELFPRLDVALVRDVLGRTGYSRIEEQEAEMMATVVLERSARAAVPGGAKGSGVRAVLDRLESTLGRGDRSG